MRNAMVLGLTLLVLVPGLGSAAPSATQRESQCLDPVGASICALAVLQLDLPCVVRGAGLVDCQPRIDWRAEAADPLGLPASAEWFANALVEWCPPGDLCRGVGVAFRIETCDLRVKLACGGADTYTLNLAGMRSTPGVCYDVTFHGLAWMAVYVPDPPMSRRLFGGPTLLADPRAVVVETVCP